jgi:Clr5 domain
MPSVSAVQPVPIYSTLEPRLPRVQDFYETSNSQSDQSHQWPMHPPPKPRKSAPRTLNLDPMNWEQHRDEIKRLWKDEDRTLPETIQIMTKSFGFTAS